MNTTYETMKQGEAKAMDDSGAWASLRAAAARWLGHASAREDAPTPSPMAPEVATMAEAVLDSADPLVAWLAEYRSVVRLADLSIDSDLQRALESEGVEMVAPLLNNGALVGLLTLGAHKSDQQYSAGDRRLLATLTDQVAPSFHVARLVQEQRRQAIAHERLEQDLRIAHDIQLSLLPHSIPQFPGWTLETKYQPALAVGGDFFDLVQLDDHRLGVLIGDVTGKGMPAALIMATTRTILRSVADGGAPPAEVLKRANNLLLRDMTPGYFVTCLYAVIDTQSGHVTLANAGHNPPFQRTPARGGAQAPAGQSARQGSVRMPVRVEKIDAVGLPLGLMQEVLYDEVEAVIEPGGCVLFYSDGITEAHNAKRTLFGFDRLQTLIETLDPSDCSSVLDALLASLAAFTGAQNEQEDDITLLALHRL